MRAGTLQISGGVVETGWWGPGPSEAPTLVLLHEGLGSVALWRDVPARLAAATGWGVFAYSRFGYGGSDTAPLPRPMTYLHDEALVVLPEVLRAAGIRRAVLVGHSDGGSIAAIYAGAVNAPTLSTGQPPPPPQPRASQPGTSWPGLARPPTTLLATAREVPGGRNTASASHAGAGPDGATTLLGLVTIAAHFVVEDLNIDSIRQIKKEYDTGTLRQRLSRYHSDVDAAFRGWNDAWLDQRFQNFDITGFLPAIQVPILALQGADDPYGTDVQLHVLEANVTAPIKIQRIAGARHSPHLDATDETLAAIVTFIASLPRDSCM